MLVSWWHCCFTLGIALLLLSVRSSSAADWSEGVSHPDWVTGSWSCMAVACHGGSKRDRSGRDPVGGEFEVWRTQDPHARANALLEGEKFAAILERLEIIERNASAPASWQSGARRRIVRAGQEARLQECLNCHNPAQAPSSWTPENILPADAIGQGDGSADSFAIGCETCHGPAKHWLASHYRRDFNRFAATQQGFQDTKDLVWRGRICAQCHIGDDQRDMNHDMIAAGHPPLRFELASYQRALPKHWNDRRERTVTRDYEIKLWLAGQIANVDSGLALTASRLVRSGDSELYEPSELSRRPVAPWPEFAEQNCSSCHQALHPLIASDPRWNDQNSGSTRLGWNAGLLQEISTASANEIATLYDPIEQRTPRESVERQRLAEQMREFRIARFRPTMVHEFPAIFFQQLRYQQPIALRLSSPTRAVFDYDANLQHYAFVSAAAKAQWDEGIKSGHHSDQARAVLSEIQRLKPLLVPRSAHRDAFRGMAVDAEIGQKIAEAAEKLRGPLP
jgi:hypothetical protein